MIPPLHQSRVWLFSASCCIFSSEIVFLLFYCIVRIEIRASPILSYEDLLFCLVAGLITGLIKSFIVSSLAYLAKPSFRWMIILGSTFVLTILEGFLYHGVWNLPVPNLR
jgi:L-cystine uptake protein TcyP (sodium:dicarboxylate symporter family)